MGGMCSKGAAAGLAPGMAANPHRQLDESGVVQLEGGTSGLALQPESSSVAAVSSVIQPTGHGDTVPSAGGAAPPALAMGSIVAGGNGASNGAGTGSGSGSGGGSMGSGSSLRLGVSRASSRREAERRGLRQGLVHEVKHLSVFDQYEVIKEIGHGMTGKVFQVRHKGTGEIYALKCESTSPYTVTMRVIGVPGQRLRHRRRLLYPPPPSRPNAARHRHGDATH